MPNLIERLEALARTSTPRPWETDAEQRTGSWPYQVTTPEGGVVIDEIENTADAVLVVAAVNALSDLLKLARAASRLRIEEVAGVGTVIVAWPDVRAALEPLLREVQP